MKTNRSPLPITVCSMDPEHVWFPTLPARLKGGHAVQMLVCRDLDFQGPGRLMVDWCMALRSRASSSLDLFFVFIDSFVAHLSSKKAQRLISADKFKFSSCLENMPRFSVLLLGCALGRNPRFFISAFGFGVNLILMQALLGPPVKRLLLIFELSHDRWQPRFLWLNAEHTRCSIADWCNSDKSNSHRTNHMQNTSNSAGIIGGICKCNHCLFDLFFTLPCIRLIFTFTVICSGSRENQ